MDAAQAWRALLENWPKEIERDGILITKQGEQVAFANYLLNPGLVLLERRAPDASGSRKVIVAYDQVAVVKMASPAPLKDFEPLGFRASSPRRPAASTGSPASTGSTAATRPTAPTRPTPSASTTRPASALSSRPAAVNRPADAESPSSTTPPGVSKPTVGASERRNGDRRKNPRD